jgi:hypothetical protein
MCLAVSLHVISASNLAGPGDRWRASAGAAASRCSKRRERQLPVWCIGTERLAEELPSAATLAELEARDAARAGALVRIDAMIARAMRIRLDHALAADTSIGAPTRSVFASTIVGYAGRLSPPSEHATWPCAARRTIRTRSPRP